MEDLKLNVMEYLKASFNNETFFTLDDRFMVDIVLPVIMKFPSKIKDVKMRNVETKQIRKAKQIVIDNREGLSIMDGKMFVLFPKNTEILVYLD